MPNPSARNPLEIERGWDRNDLQVRILFGMDTFAERENGTCLDILHYYWSSLQIDKNRLPTISEFRIRDILPSAEENDIGLIDTTAEKPEDFVIVHHPASPIPGWGRELNGETLAAYPNRMHAKSLALEFRRCKRWKLPLYHEIDQVIGGIARHYTRLMVPLGDEGGAVAGISYAVRWLEPQRRLSIEE